MQFVLDEIVDLIRKDMDTVKKENILTGFPRYPNISDVLSSDSSLPSIFIFDEGFKFEPGIFGVSFGETREETSQEFSGDGKILEFTLNRLPIRPIISVEAPLGNKLLEYEDFTVNYKSGLLKFRKSPPKGKNNLTVRYLAVGSVGESRGIRLSVKCLIDCFARNIYECDKLVLGVIRTILLSNEVLSHKGYSVKPITSFRIDPNGRNFDSDSGNGRIHTSAESSTKKGGTSKKSSGDSELSTLDLFGRRLIYEIDTSIEVETKIPTIKEIHVKGMKQYVSS